MGNVHISIQAVGAHHNDSNPDDLDRLFVEFVDKVKKTGAYVTAATITYGGCEDYEQAKRRIVAKPVSIGGA